MSSFRTSRCVFASAIAIVCSMMPAQAITLIDVSGPNNFGTITEALSNNPGVGFSLASAHANVSIVVPMAAFGGSGDWNLKAYLTTQLGPGTTAGSHEIAALTQTITVPGSGFTPPYTITPMTVFSGLNLSAGNYYLTLSGTFNTQNAWWVGSPTADLNTTAAGGAAVTEPYYYIALPESYLPASGVNTSTFYGRWFTVTGDPVQTGVPEPASIALTLAGGLVLLHLRRSTPRHQ